MAEPIDLKCIRCGETKPAKDFPPGSRPRRCDACIKKDLLQRQQSAADHIRCKCGTVVKRACYYAHLRTTKHAKSMEKVNENKLASEALDELLADELPKEVQDALDIIIAALRKNFAARSAPTVTE